MMPRFDAPNLHHSAVLFYQLTRPRGARHAARQRTAHGDAVSTHAPARGATAGKHLARRYGCVSTHAPARGATQAQPQAVARAVVSTHAPARGATPRASGSRVNPHVSTHAPARGATSVVAAQDNDLRFQLTRPRGARLAQARAGLRSLSTVSTHAPARGATSAATPRKPAQRVSTHAPARGATKGSKPWKNQNPCFNSRAREGRDV